jgi:hypothetical protein
MELPDDIVELLTTYIRVEMHEIVPPVDYDPRRVYDLHGSATANPGLFLRAVSEKVLPAGGEASRGGARLVWELLTTDLFATDPHAKAMLDAGVAWVRATRREMVGYEM